MVAYRIADARHPIYDSTGAMLHGGRWNSAGRRVIYAASTYAGALLEILVHTNLPQPPRTHMAVTITFPEDVDVEEIAAGDIKGWDEESMIVPRKFGDKWIDEGRTAVLKVPQIVTAGRESNFVINAVHPLFSRISASAPEPIHWDPRLFNRSQALPGATSRREPRRGKPTPAMVAPPTSSQSTAAR